MKNLLLIKFILIFFSFQSFAQSIQLVEDVAPGLEGSFTESFQKFQDKILYWGINHDGESAIMQYDKTTDQITTLLLNEDVNGEILALQAWKEKIMVISYDDQERNVYISTKGDLSDLTLVYQVEGPFVAQYGVFDNSAILIVEMNLLDNFDGTTNVIIIEPDNTITTLYEELEDSPFDYIITSHKNLLFIATQINSIDNQDIIVYDVELKEFVPFNDIVHDYVPCGKFKRFRYIGNNFIYYECFFSVLYDLENEVREPLLENYSYVMRGFDDTILFKRDDDIIKRNRVTFEEEVILENIIQFTIFNEHIIASTSKDGNLEIINYNTDTDALYRWITDIEFDGSIAFSGPIQRSNGIHIGFYVHDSDKGIMTRINGDNFDIIGPIQKLNWGTRLIALEEDIYFFQEDSVVGEELFKIDYFETSTNDLDKITSSIMVTPNPATSFIEVNDPIHGQPSSIAIFDINGELIRQFDDHMRIYVESLSSGVYVVKCRYSHGTVGMARFVVKRI